MSPADLTKPFDPSCCDGGGSSDSHSSAQMCGCDPGAGWTCYRHQREQIVRSITPHQTDCAMHYVTPIGSLEQHKQDVVDKTWNYAGKLKDFQDEVANAALGLAGEAGECADLAKKMLFHSEKPGRREALLLELGDVAYYFIKMMDLFGFTLEEVLEANKAKLTERHLRDQTAVL